MSTADNRIQLWHASLIRDVAVLFVPDGVVVDEPVVVTMEGDGDGVVSCGMLVVVLGANSRANVIKRVTGSDDGEVLFLDGTVLHVGDNSSLTITDIQRTNDESLYFAHGGATLSRDAILHRTEVHVGADFAKARFVTEVAGPGADARLSGIYCATGEQHVDVRTVQLHRAHHTTSRAYYKGAVREEAHSIYQGLIQVDPDAPGTDAYLTNRNLVLSDTARADSIPSLNIRTDDVRCSHGSTTGKLDEDQLYYLRTRGWTEEEARRTLIEGYFEDLVHTTPESVHDEIRVLVSQRVIAEET
jgi:Fe-S cluster assembly protein SufD